MTGLRQVNLQRHISGCRWESQRVWVNDRPDLKVGVFITLKNSDEPEKLWEVKEISEMTLQDYDIKRGWNNNI